MTQSCLRVHQNARNMTSWKFFLRPHEPTPPTSGHGLNSRYPLVQNTDRSYECDQSMTHVTINLFSPPPSSARSCSCPHSLFVAPASDIPSHKTRGSEPLDTGQPPPPVQSRSAQSDTLATDTKNGRAQRRGIEVYLIFGMYSTSSSSLLIPRPHRPRGGIS